MIAVHNRETDKDRDRLKKKTAKNKQTNQQNDSGAY